MNEKQQQLTFEKGITNVPSDAICSDNALEESLGMVYDNGEHRVIQKPKEFITIPGELVYVHTIATEKHYIYKGTVNGVYKLKWRTADNSKYGTVLDTYQNDINNRFASIGNTLVVYYNCTILCIMWKPDKTNDAGSNGEYEKKGNIPIPKLEFAPKTYYQDLSEILEPGAIPSDWTIYKNRFTQILTDESWFANFDTIYEIHQEDYNNAIVGGYSKLRKEIKVENHFSNPFFIRYALELFDGSYIYASAPILLFPSIKENTIAWSESLTNSCVFLWVSEYELMFRATFDYTDWVDIVKDVVVFASEEIPIYDTSKNALLRRLNAGEYHCDCIALTDNDNNNPTYHDFLFTYAGHTDTDWYFKPFERYNESTILSGLSNKSIFYKIAKLGLKQNSSSWTEMASYIDPHTVENLTTQEQMTDDYYTHCPLSAMCFDSYNNRIILSNVMRGFYEGYSSMLGYHNTSEYTYYVYVHIHTSSGERLVKKTWTTKEKVGLYFFYPDHRAYQADFYLSGGWVCTLELKEHSGLNGAYYLANSLPSGAEGTPSAMPSHTPTRSTLDDQVNETPETLYNQLFVSEVNNPFLFRPEGNITVGNGNIINVSTLTQALSQGQFGQYPLIIFSSEGIWAASIATTGYIESVRPMSRDICNNRNSVLQTDGAVFFSSEKGLMVVVGNEVKCVSEQLSGKSDTPFQKFLKTAFLAYDYRDSLLWLFDGSQNGSNFCWVYSVKSGAFGRFDFGTNTIVTNAVNDYPDYLLQSGQTIYTLLNRENINSDTKDDYSAQLITRPMKLENALALKSIMQIRHIHDVEGSMTMQIYASNNLSTDPNSWVELHSLRGTPWKYYKFKYNFSNLKATDRFAGTVLITQERRTNKLR